MHRWDSGSCLRDEAFAAFYTQDTARLGAFIARDLIRKEDACIAINANGNPRGGPKVRFSDLEQGRAGCVEMLDYVAKAKEVWRGKGMEIGVFPYPGLGAQKAADALAGEPLLHRAILLLCLGDDADHAGLPLGMIRTLAGRGIEAYALYFGLEDANDPEVQSRTASWCGLVTATGAFPEMATERGLWQAGPGATHEGDGREVLPGHSGVSARGRERTSQQSPQGLRSHLQPPRGSSHSSLPQDRRRGRPEGLESPPPPRLLSESGLSPQRRAVEALTRN